MSTPHCWGIFSFVVYSFTVDVDRQLVIVTFSATLTDTEPHAYMAEMLASVPYGAGWRSLIDLTAVERLNMTAEGVRTALAATRSGPRFQKASVAYVAPEGSTAFELARMYEVLAEGESFRVAVFTNRDAAMAWLFE